MAPLKHSITAFSPLPYRYRKEQASMGTTYYIMHGNQKTASIDTEGRCTIYHAPFLPYSLWLEECQNNLDTQFHNLANFYFWCASRVLTLDRAYAKEILNSIGMTQAMTDRERAQIALSYHALCLTDIYWVKESAESITFAEINLYDNPLSNAFVDVSLRGRQISITNSYLIADDLSTGGTFPKAWYRRDDGIVLLKNGNADAVERELLASKICQCFSCNQVIYQESIYDGLKVSQSRLMTSAAYGIASREAFGVYAVNHGLDVQEFIDWLDRYSYDMMNILDYLIGNTDRHWGNWGFLVDNATNRPMRLHDFMDFNKAFSQYGTLSGANCLTVPFSTKMTQLEAAQKAVQRSGLNQLADIQKEWFIGHESWWDMFCQRLSAIKKCGF